MIISELMAAAICDDAQRVVLGLVPEAMRRLAGITGLAATCGPAEPSHAKRTESTSEPE